MSHTLLQRRYRQTSSSKWLARITARVILLDDRRWHCQESQLIHLVDVGFQNLFLSTLTICYVANINGIVLKCTCLPSFTMSSDSSVFWVTDVFFWIKLRDLVHTMSFPMMFLNASFTWALTKYYKHMNDWPSALFVTFGSLMKAPCFEFGGSSPVVAYLFIIKSWMCHFKHSMMVYGYYKSSSTNRLAASIITLYSLNPHCKYWMIRYSNNNQTQRWVLKESRTQSHSLPLGRKIYIRLYLSIYLIPLIKSLLISDIIRTKSQLS